MTKFTTTSYASYQKSSPIYTELCIQDEESYHQELQTYFPLKLTDSSPVVVDLIHFPSTETKESCLKYRKNQHDQGFLHFLQKNIEWAWLKNLVDEQMKERT